jgi:hypothetical protein
VLEGRLIWLALEVLRLGTNVVRTSGYGLVMSGRRSAGWQAR